MSEINLTASIHFEYMLDNYNWMHPNSNFEQFYPTGNYEEQSTCEEYFILLCSDGWMINANALTPLKVKCARNQHKQSTHCNDLCVLSWP